jgi:hypothetical protein
MSTPSSSRGGEQARVAAFLMERTGIEPVTSGLQSSPELPCPFLCVLDLARKIQISVQVREERYRPLPT